MSTLSTTAPRTAPLTASAAVSAGPRRHPLRTGLLYLAMALIAIAMVFPFFLMVTTSLKSQGESFRFPPTMLPETWHWANYRELFELMPMGHFLFNSVKLTVLNVVGVLLSSSMAAFALGCLQFPGRRPLFGATLATLMIPYQVTLIPAFIIFMALGWKDTHYPLWVPSFTGSAFGVFLLRQFFMGIPRDLYEAALIDGCSIGGILFRIYLPLSKPALTTLGVFTFMWSWNDLLNPLIYLDTLDKMPLTAGLSFFQQQHGSQWNLLMCGALISILPVLLVYFLAQRVFTQGIATSGLKG